MLDPRLAGHCDVEWHTHDPNNPFYISTCRCECLEVAQAMEQLQSEQVYVVFRGVPTVFREGDPIVGTDDPLALAEEAAANLAELHHEPFTVMAVPASSLDMALVADYQGVVVKTLQEKENDS